MVHYWRTLYRQGRLGEDKAESVRRFRSAVSGPAGAPPVEPTTKLPSTSTLIRPTSIGSIYVEFAKIHLRIESGADAALLRRSTGIAGMMITLPPKTHIRIAAGVTDLRRGFDGLSALVATRHSTGTILLVGDMIGLGKITTG